MSNHIPIPIGPADHELPEETPDVLERIAQRVQQSMTEMLAERITVADHLDQPRPITSPTSTQAESTNFDRRLYLKVLEGWKVRVKSGQPEYCCQRDPGQDWFHQLIDGELYLEYDHERLCLNCALRKGVVTDDRLFWQRGLKHRPQPLGNDSPRTPEAGPFESNIED